MAYKDRRESVIKACRFVAYTQPALFNEIFCPIVSYKKENQLNNPQTNLYTRLRGQAVTEHKAWLGSAFKACKCVSLLFCWKAMFEDLSVTRIFFLKGLAAIGVQGVAGISATGNQGSVGVQVC